MTIGDKIKKARLSAGLSQSQLARKAGLCKQTISNIETNRHGISLTSLLRIAKALKTSLDKLSTIH